MTFIMPNHTSAHDSMAAELDLDDLQIAFLQFNVIDVFTLDLKKRHGSADVGEFMAAADNKNSKRKEQEPAAGAFLTASNFQITCKWELFI